MTRIARYTIRPRQEAWLEGHGLHGILRGLFSRNLILVDLTAKLLDEIKSRDGKRLRAEEWQKMVKKLGCKLSNYYGCVNNFSALDC